MSCHPGTCAVCGKGTCCCNDEHVLGAGRGSCMDEEPKVEFCSLECFKELRKTMVRREEIARELYEWDWS